MQKIQHRDFVTVVSGLPRSGTSMMMRMLDAGGVPAFADNDRQADADNPCGYFEYQAIKKVGEESAWMAQAVGHAIKAIHVLLYHLPRQYRYRILFMRRDLGEVIASQETMLQRLGAAPGAMDPKVLACHFETQLQQAEAWVLRQSNMSLIDLDYAEVVHDPSATACQVAKFLGGGLDTAKMAAAVEPALYRQRLGQVNGNGLVSASL
jgi:hypothetical protein